MDSFSVFSFCLSTFQDIMISQNYLEYSDLNVTLLKISIILVEDLVFKKSSLKNGYENFKMETLGLKRATR